MAENRVEANAHNAGGCPASNALMDAGITPGPAVGKALNTLLRAVMEGRLPNEKAALLAALEKEGLL